MLHKISFTLIWLIMGSAVIFLQAQQANRDLVTSTPDLVAFWMFQEDAGQSRNSTGTSANYPLREQAGEIQRIKPSEGAPFGEYAALLEEGQWLSLPRSELGDLNIHGKEAQLTVIAWIKRHQKTRTANRCEAIAGVWDEPRSNRQYCLFLNIKVNRNYPGLEILDRVSGHISDVGGPTPGHRWCEDVAQSKSTVPFEQWVCVGFSYDGKAIHAYYNGEFEANEKCNPYVFPNGIYDAGEKGSDFKVGVSDELHALDGDKANFFAGVIGGIAVFDRALTDKEMEHLAQAILK